MSAPVWHGRNGDGLGGSPVHPHQLDPSGPGQPAPGEEGPRRRRAAIRRQTLDLLGELGEDVETVVNRLGTAGVHGTPTNAENCAVAVYLRAVMTGDPRVRTVSVGNTSVMVSPPQGWRRSVAVSLPPAVRRFIEAFDERRFPQLERSEGSVPST
jgi:hypothetical protein